MFGRMPRADTAERECFILFGFPKQNLRRPFRMNDSVIHLPAPRALDITVGISLWSGRSRVDPGMCHTLDLRSCTLFAWRSILLGYLSDGALLAFSKAALNKEWWKFDLQKGGMHSKNPFVTVSLNSIHSVVQSTVIETCKQHSSLENRIQEKKNEIQVFIEVLN